MRAPHYKNATNRRLSLGNIGMEWIGPSALLLALCVALMQVFHLPLLYRFLALAVLVIWPLFMFSYLHDRMHLQGFWMERTAVLSIWFRHARRLHDIHHRSLDDTGRMDRNFGIGFFFFDWVFRTNSSRHCPLNWCGYRAAIYRHNLEDPGPDDVSSFPLDFAYRRSDLAEPPALLLRRGSNPQIGQGKLRHTPNAARCRLPAKGTQVISRWPQERCSQFDVLRGQYLLPKQEGKDDG
jgi:hypothetical protein